VAATRESESDRAHVRFSDLLMCADLTDLRSTNRPNSTWYTSHIVLILSDQACLLATDLVRLNRFFADQAWRRADGSLHRTTLSVATSLFLQ